MNTYANRPDKRISDQLQININMTLLDHYPKCGKREEKLRKDKREKIYAEEQIKKEITI